MDVTSGPKPVMIWCNDGAMIRKIVVAAMLAVAALGAVPARAQQTGVESVDRVAVRWHARATGGVRKPQFITARVLAFEARLEALVEGGPAEVPYTSEHVRRAIQRHITEVILASQPVDPEPKPKDVALYAEAARALYVERLGEGGEGRLDAARQAEGISSEELDAILRRRARASWYLDKMVAPMLRPSELDLREVHKRGETPFTERRFEEVEEELRRWYVSTRLADALDTYYRNVRSRVKVVVVGPPGRTKTNAQ
jgi:hypothetical protein